MVKYFHLKCITYYKIKIKQYISNFKTVQRIMGQEL